MVHRLSLMADGAISDMQVSIIVPTFNRAASLARCIAALRAQRFPRAQYELIVADDGSTDGTASWLSQQTDLRVIRLAHAGPAAARNAGARLAQSAVLAFTDDDCIVPSSWLCDLLAALDGQDVVGGRIVNAEPANLYAETAQAIVDALVDELNGELQNGGMLTSNNIAYRRAVFEAVGGFDERFTIGGEERDLNYRLWRRGARLRFAPQIVVQHIVNLSLRRFLKQQFNYGRGAYLFYHQAPAPERLASSFYKRLLTQARQQPTTARRAAYLTCLFLAQCAVLCGYTSMGLIRARRD